MASKSLGTLTLDLVAKTGGFVNGMSKAERESEKFRRKTAQNMKIAGAAIAAASVAAVAGLTAVVSSQLKLIDSQAKLAQRLRTTYSSLETLGRAGNLAGVSMQQIEVASRSLDINLGKAAQGVGAQADAFKRLSLNVDELAKLPLDQRIATINKALRENVSVTERAAVAADIFGSRGAAAIQQLNPEVIAEAARQTEIFGLNLSDIDAAKVEQANDALSTFGLLGQGIGKQLTVELAPILKAVGDEFLRSAEEAGGLGTVVQDTTRKALTALAFVVDAADGVGRAFKIAANTMVIVFNDAAGEIARRYAILLARISVVPGINFDQATDDALAFFQSTKQITREAAAEIKAALETPLAGNRLIEFYDRAQAAGEAAAAAAVQARADAEVYEEALEDVAEATGKVTDGLEKISVSSKKLGRDPAFEKVLDNLNAYWRLLDDLRTEEERLTDQLRDRFGVMQAIKGLSDEERTKVGSRILGAAFGDAPQFGGVDAAVAGPAGEVIKLQRAQSELDKWYKDSLERLNQYRNEKLATEEAYNEQERILKQQHEDALANIEQQRQLLSLATTEALFGNMADIARQFAGEQSGIFKALFAVQKAAAIAQSLVAIQAGIAQAAANPFPANLAAMASVAAATASIIGNIQAVSIAGMAHDGMDSVPKTGTWLLEKGERVTTADTSAKLDRTLNDVQSTMQAGGGGDQNIRIVNAWDTAMIGDYMGSSSGERVIMNAVRKNSRTIRSLATA